MLNSVFKRKEDENRLRKEGRLPPGQSLTQKFPVLHYGPVPNFNPATWDFRIWGEVQEEKDGRGMSSTTCHVRRSLWISTA